MVHSSCNPGAQPGGPTGLLRWAVSVVAVCGCLCAGCSAAKPAPSGSVGPVPLSQQKKTPSKPVAVELPPGTPVPQPEAKPQSVTRTPVRVDTPRTMLPRPPMPARQPAPAPTQQTQVQPPSSREVVRPSAASETATPVEAQPGPSQPQTATVADATADSKPSTPPRPRNDVPEEMVTVNFEQVDVKMVLKSIGEITGTNFILPANVTGPITVMSPTRIPRSKVYGFLQSVLDVYGYATIETDNGVKVVPKADAVKRNLPVHIGADPADIPQTDALVAQILPLKYADAAEVSQIIESFLPTGTQSVSCPRINAILITDTSSNIHYIAEIIQLLDVEGSKEKVETLPLKYASAKTLSEYINSILEKAPGTMAAPAGNARVRITSGTGKNPKVLPDERTNQLIVVANDQDVEMIRGLVAKLDVERPTGTDNVHVKFLNHADANEVSRSLESAVTGMKVAGAVDSKQLIQITPHSSTNAIIVVASPQDFEVISAIADKLDIVREQVDVEMLILEVTEEALKKIGVDWATMDQAVSDSIRGFGLTNLGPRAAYTGGTLEGLAAGFWKASGSNVQIGAILQALKTTTGVNILSSSSVTTANHHPASFIAGENRPFVRASRITEATSNPTTPTVIKEYDYKDVGVSMKITPSVSQSGLITLNIDGEITKLLESATTSADTPVTAKRQVKTEATIPRDQTVVIGGLTRDDATRVEKKVPLLGDLPLVGLLFRSREEQMQKTNLLIFITPHVMASQEDWIELSSKKREEMPPAPAWN